MSNQFIQLPALLKEEELVRIESLVSKASFVDGKMTASLAAKAVKENRQIDPKDAILQEIHEVLNGALQRNALFQVTALPRSVHPFLISKYGAGQYYGWHVDSPVMGMPPIRTDLAMTVFLSDPATYTGGELVLQTGAGIVNLKPPKGDAIIYPCQYVHGVNEIKSGERLAAVTWIQSAVRSPEQRQLLMQLNQVHSILLQKDMQAQETQLLLQTYSHLFRMWADV